MSGDQAIATGNTLTFREETAFEGTTFTLETTLEADPGGNTLTGTQTLTIESLSFPQNNCTTSANLVATRTTTCLGDA